MVFPTVSCQVWYLVYRFLIFAFFFTLKQVYSLEDGIVTTEFQSYFFIGRYCGVEDPPTIEINNDAVKIDFHSSAMINGAGFNVSYVSVGKYYNAIGSM